MKTENHKDESLFYCDVEINRTTKQFVDAFKKYSTTNAKQVYILKEALGTGKKHDYLLNNVAIILTPKHPILILNFGQQDDEALNEYLLDFRDDLGYLAEKYDYTKILGRSRKWPEHYFSVANLSTFDIESYIKQELDHQYHRKIDLLISLLTGSINNIDVVGINEPETLLDKVKQKIILFDGQQSRFIYQPTTKNTVLIQGMAGTGKTELLLHKLKDVYSKEKDSVIAFTCYNKVLAKEMKQRIPRFFNFMKVDEQIDWENRLFVFSSWGSANNPKSGMYRYICYKYQVPFSTYHENNNFDSLCRSCLEAINAKEDFAPCFDYIFIDESQDFQDGFFELCKKVARKTVYIAGDIFQNIFDTSKINTKLQPDYLLNKCYRTDPKTLMFAHAVGMGLYESPKLNWLDKSDWISCGYSYLKNSDTVELSRKPLRRFEDLQATNTIQLQTCDEDSYADRVIDCVDAIRNEHPSALPEDIAVIILGNYGTMCTIADEVALSLQEKYAWDSSKGYVTKERTNNEVYISNVNNVKGLEFPFVICVVPRQISSNILIRNSIYMALTRSFLTSYFIVDDVNETFAKTYSQVIDNINTSGKMSLTEPSEEEREEMAAKIQITLTNNKRSIADILDEFFGSECPNLEKDIRKVVSDFIIKIPTKLTEDEIKQRARALLQDYFGLR